jgi:ferric-dicitrate binding protein FerR (iron transport regulator)
MEAPVIKNVLFEYLSGRANPLERQLVEDWLKSEENTETFHQWLLEWENRSPQFIPDQEQAMIRLMETGYGQITRIYLEDGSSVALNANSRLKIPRFGFYGDVRTVSLDGEAEFSVSHTVDHKRFVVKTSDTFQVEVLGTQFSVFARPRGTKVALSHGKIRIDYSQGEKKQELLMKPGDLATLQKSGAITLINETDATNFSAWKEQRFIFNATSVLEISALIEESFGRKIRIANDKIARRTITGNFKTENAEELLRTVAEVLDLKMETKGNAILITDN